MTGRSAADAIPGAGPGAGPFVSRSAAPVHPHRRRRRDADCQHLAGCAARDTKITWSAASKLVSLSATTGNSVTVTGNNSTNRAEWVPVRATAANGFYVQAFVNVEPKYIDPPTFVKQPVIGAPLAGKVSVRYLLNLGGRPDLSDQSQITWSQCEDAACTSPRKIAVSRGDLPLRTLHAHPRRRGQVS